DKRPCHSSAYVRATPSLVRQPVNWLSKLEEERRREAAVERDKDENRRHKAEELRGAVATMEARLRPVLGPLIDDIERRIGMRLGTRITGVDFTLSAPSAANSDLVHEHRIVFSNPQGETRVRVTAIRAGQTNRNSEYKPSDVTLAEWQ